MKGTNTPVQCANTDLTIDPATGHLVMRQTTPSGGVSTINFDANYPATTPATVGGRKLLSSPDDNTNAVGRDLLQAALSPATPVGTLKSICKWHSLDFYNPSTGLYLQGACSQFPYSTKMNIPMLSNNGQSAPSYQSAMYSQAITSLASISYGDAVTSAFCKNDLIRAYFGPTSFIDFCFKPWPVCSSTVTDKCCFSTIPGSTASNCPRTPFVNYANLAFDTVLFDLPCVMNKFGQVSYKSGANTGVNNACLRPLGKFNKFGSDPLYRLSNQLPLNPLYSNAWYPNATTTTSDVNGAFPKGRHLLGMRELLQKGDDSGGMG